MSILLTGFSVQARKTYPTSFLSASCVLTRLGHLLGPALAEIIKPSEHFILAFEDGVDWSLPSMYCKRTQTEPKHLV
jgi:hypothetical protein